MTVSNPLTEKHMTAFNNVKDILINALQLDSTAMSFTAETFLLGSLAELDSMTVMTVITMLEEHYGISFDDDEINGRVFATLGSLTALVDAKLAQPQP